jgi:hypothetical protein
MLQPRASALMGIMAALLPLELVFQLARVLEALSLS